MRFPVLPTLLLGLCLLAVAPASFAQRSAVADVGFAYRNVQRTPGRSPFAYGPGRIVLADGTERPGEVRLRTRAGLTVVAFRNGPDFQLLPDGQVREFFIEDHHYVRRPALSGQWVEVIREGGARLELFEQHGRGHAYLFRHVATQGITAVSLRLPVRGYDADFETQLRTLFADRPDLIKLIDGHHLTAFNLHKVVDAYNSGEAVQF